MSQIVLQAVTAASVPTPASGRYAIFANSSDSNFPSQKDSSGTTTRLGTTGATGATGATGSTGSTGATGATGGAAQLASITAASAAIAATETVVVSTSLAASYLTAGKSFRIKAAGVGTTGVTPGSDVFRIRIGPTTLTGTIPTTVTALGIAAVTAQPFDFEALITLRTSGASGAIIGECVLQVDNVATGRYAVLNSLSAIVATVAVDTTVTNLLELTYISGNAGSSNIFHVAEIEVLSSGPAGSITVSENRLTGDVAITTDTYADGPSLSLAAGTYLLDGHVTVYAASAGWVTVKLMSGASPLDACDGYVDTATAGLTFPVHAYVVLGTTTTVKIQATTHLSSSGTIKTTPQFNTTGLTNLGSYLRATKIA